MKKETQIRRLTTYTTPIEANLAKTKLEDEGIPCFLTNEHFSSLMPHYNRIMGSGVQLMIFEDDFEKACVVLNLKKGLETVCPDCGSSNIKTNLGQHKTRKFLAIAISLFSGIPFNNIYNVLHCNECGAEF